MYKMCLFKRRLLQNTFYSRRRSNNSKTFRSNILKSLFHEILSDNPFVKIYLRESKIFGN